MEKKNGIMNKRERKNKSEIFKKNDGFFDFITQTVNILVLCYIYDFRV